MMIVQDVIVHECAPAFARTLFERYLGQYYEVHVIRDPAPRRYLDNTGFWIEWNLMGWVEYQKKYTEVTLRPWLLSQHQFAWPEHRPRAYTVLTLKRTCSLDMRIDGIDLIHRLMRCPTMPLANLLCAPKETWTQWKLHQLGSVSSSLVLCLQRHLPHLQGSCWKSSCWSCA